MELLEFKCKILELCNAKEIKDIGGVLMSAVINNDNDFFIKYENIINNSKDWLQALWQYYEADRAEKKQDYTPKSLCKLVSVLAGKCNTVYDCCGGSGALTIQMLKSGNVESVFVEELDEKVIPFLLFNLCLHNASGYVVNGDALTGEQFKIYKLTKSEKYSTCRIVDKVEKPTADVSISNPPYNIKWNAPSPIEALSDNRFPVVPPANNANYAFVLNCLASAKEKVVMILPLSIADSKNEYDVRKYMIDNDFIETVALMPDNMFETTSISTCILVLNKNKKHKGEICFIDSRKNCVTEEREQKGQFGGVSHTNRTYKKKYNVLSDDNIDKILTTIETRQNTSGFSEVVSNDVVAENEYKISPSTHIAFEKQETKHRDSQEIADNINYISRMKNSCKLIINETIAKRLGLDIETFKEGKNISENMKKQMKPLGIDIETEDYIQFTKTKNEFVFKCNDKELLPEILLQFLTVWKNQIALLNSMQNKYLEEMRDALLTDFMSGKVTFEQEG